MKKTLTLVLFLGLTSTLSAQFLLRTETTKAKNVSYTKNIVINLDTMPYVSFISVFSNTPTVEHGRHTGMDIGDGYSWIWIDETLLPIRARGYVDILNRLTRGNWVFQLPVYGINLYDGGGNSYQDWLFKRRDAK